MTHTFRRMTKELKIRRAAQLNTMIKNTKSRIPLHLISHVIVLLAGLLAGIGVQKYLGLGNILRAAGIPYPTAAAPVPPVTAPVGIPTEHQGRMLLFILAGQSNMVGWAPIPEGEQTDPRIFVFGKDYRWRIASHPIEDASNQVDMVSENLIARFGPAMDFAFASLERNPDVVIGLIPCAKNSSGIIQWQRDLSDQSLYGSCLKRARAASAMGKISGLLFFQGETDAANPILYPEPAPHPSDWARLFTMFIVDFRADVQEPELPVVFAQIGSTGVSNDFPNWNVVKEQQASVQLPGLVMIVTEDLPLLDGVHFTADSYRILGRRFADSYWEMIDQ